MAQSQEPNKWGFRSIAEAIYLRDHITRQLELAAVAADPAEREARCTVPGTQDIYACGDCAAVPDLTRPGQVCGIMRVLADWTLNIVRPPEATSFGVIRAQSVPLDTDNPPT